MIGIMLFPLSVPLKEGIPSKLKRDQISTV